MKLITVLGGISLVALTAAITSQVVSQDKPEGGYGQEPPEWMKYAEPGESHKKLEAFVGQWDQTVKWWMYPEAEPSESTGTAEYRWIMGGRFLKGTYGGEFAGQRFEGMDILGYDNFRQEYIAFWLDNMSTSFMFTRGQYDPQAKAITMRGVHDDVMTGQKDQPLRTVTSFQGDDTLVYEMYGPGPDGKEFMTLQVTSTRRK